MNAFGDDESVLVVGGTGFIGAHLVKKCLNDTPFVTCLNLEGAGSSRLLLPDVEYIQADVSNKKQLESVLYGRSFKYVINLSGYIDHTNYFSGGRKTIESHFAGLLNLIDCLDKDALKGFVQIGSSDEYGNLPSPIGETVREMPISPYSLAKVAATQFIQMLSRTEGFPGVVLRLFLVYGPGQDSNRFLPQIIKGCLNDESFKTSEGKQLRDFCYIDDIVDAIMKAAILPEARGQVINVASGTPISIRNTIEKVIDLIGNGKPCFGGHPYRVGESMQLYADISLARQLLGWEPCITLEDGLKKTIEYYKEQMENE